MEKRIRVLDGVNHSELFGNLDINLKMIKEATGVDVVQRDGELVLIYEEEKPDPSGGASMPSDEAEVKAAADEGVERESETQEEKELPEIHSGAEASVALAEKAIQEFMNVVSAGEILDKQKASYILNLCREGISYRENHPAKDIICFTHSGKPLKPKTIGQKKYVNEIRNKEIVFGIGPAGTGKTYIAVAMAVNALKNKEVSKIILARPAVEAGERLGFLPGDLQEKVDPYLRPLYDALNDVLGRDAAMRLREKETIEVIPLAYMRGRTLDNSFIILDEAQNSTREQMKMFLTRMGFGSKVVVTGDVTQIDLPRGKKSGLVEAERVLKPVKEIGFCYLKDTDVVRHELVRKIVNAYDAFYAKHPEELGE